MIELDIWFGINWDYQQGYLQNPDREHLYLHGV